MLQTSQFEQKAQNGYLKEWLLLFVTLIVLQNKNSSTRSDHQSLSPYSKAIEEVIIRAVPDLQVVLETVKIAEAKGLEDLNKLKQLRIALEKKMDFQVPKSSSNQH